MRASVTQSMRSNIHESTSLCLASHAHISAGASPIILLAQAGSGHGYCSCTVLYLARDDAERESCHCSNTPLLPKLAMAAAECAHVMAVACVDPASNCWNNAPGRPICCTYIRRTSARAQKVLDSTGSQVHEAKNRCLPATQFWTVRPNGQTVDGGNIRDVVLQGRSQR